MRITALKRNTRAPNYFIVEVDGARFASLPEEVTAELGLTVGLELGEEQEAALKYAAEAEDAFRRGLRMVSSRLRSVFEVMRSLRSKRLDPSACAEATGRLEASGVLDDARFAEHFARIKSGKGHGRNRILSDLSSKGVDRFLAERTVDEVLAREEVDELGQAREIAGKRIRQLGSLDSRRLETRVLSYLGRRGYTGWEVTDMVRDLVRAASQENG